MLNVFKNTEYSSVLQTCNIVFFEHSFYATYLTASQKVQYTFYLSFLRKQESSDFKLLWTPASAGVTRFLTFCKTDKFSFILRVFRGYNCFGCG